MKKTILLVMVFALFLVTEFAKADFTFGEPIHIGAILNSPNTETPLCLSPDGLEMYFISDRPGGSGDFDIWVTKRVAIDDDWGPPENPGPMINSPGFEFSAGISSDGLTLYFSSIRAGGFGWLDLWKSTRAHKNDLWTTPVNLGPIVNSQDSDNAPTISADGLELYFMSGRPGGLGGDRDIWLTTRTSLEEPWAEPVNPSVLNSAHFEGFTCLSPDGRTLFLDSDRPGGIGDYDIWLSRRQTLQDDWSTPTNLGSTINTPHFEGLGALAPDGRMLYFGSTRPGGLEGGWGDIWQAPILPVVDLNGDGIVDSADMCIVVDHWSENYPLCDVGPMPWGDGIVDVEDLIVLAEHLFEVYPSAETVEVNEYNDGGQIELELGQILVVTLESNPSTGYRWELLENNESILKQFGQAEFKSSETSDPPMVGAGGWEIFRFKAVSAGQMTLELVYHRSWEDVEPLKTFSIQVVVP